MKSSYPVYIVQGAQWGSEGKGQVAAVLADRYNCRAVVRTGSINAGHTVYYHGHEFKMQLLPTAWVNPEAMLILGPGCLIHRELLEREFKDILSATGEDIRHRLIIDHRCTVHSDTAQRLGSESGRHHVMGATGKGSSEALTERLMARGNLDKAHDLLFSSHPFGTKENGDFGTNFSRCVADSVAFLRSTLQNAPVLLEGTQGAHLDLFTGPWPYTTNRPVSTAAWLAYAGLPPTLDVRPILVARTFPIRVAGNSGPMPNETSWPALYRNIRDAARGNTEVPEVSMDALLEYEGRVRSELEAAGVPLNEFVQLWTAEQRIQYRVPLSEAPSRAMAACSVQTRNQLAKFFEMTTVTRKIRRVADWDLDTIREAIDLNGCHELWISFLNYRFPESWGAQHLGAIDNDALSWVVEQERQLGVRIGGFTTERYPQNHISLNFANVR